MIAAGRRARALSALALLLCLAPLASCAGRKGIRGTPRASAGDVGVYRVRAVDPAGKPRRFKLLLWAAAPDRLHGEIVSPVGTTVVIFDGGGGNLSIDLVRDRVAYAGPGEAAALGRIFGVRVALDALVAELVTGGGSSGNLRVEREPPTGGGLPERLAIADGDRTLVLELRERRQLPADAAIGHGRPTAGFAVRPLDAFDGYAIPDDVLLDADDDVEPSG